MNDVFDWLKETILFSQEEITYALAEYMDRQPDEKKAVLNEMVGRPRFHLEMAKVTTEMILLVASTTVLEKEEEFDVVISRVLAERASDNENMKDMRSFYIEHLDEIKAGGKERLPPASLEIFERRLDKIKAAW